MPIGALSWQGRSLGGLLSLSRGPFGFGARAVVVIFAFQVEGFGFEEGLRRLATRLRV